MPGFTHSQSNWRRVIICLGPSSTSELVTMTFVREGMVDLRDSAFFKHPRVLSLWGSEQFPAAQCTYTDSMDSWEDPAPLWHERSHLGSSNHARILNYCCSPTRFHKSTNDNSLAGLGILNSCVFVRIHLCHYHHLHECFSISISVINCTVILHIVHCSAINLPWCERSTAAA